LAVHPTADSERSISSSSSSSSGGGGGGINESHASDGSLMNRTTQQVKLQQGKNNANGKNSNFAVQGPFSMQLDTVAATAAIAAASRS